MQCVCVLHMDAMSIRGALLIFICHGLSLYAQHIDFYEKKEA